MIEAEEYNSTQEKLIKIGEPAVEPLIQALDTSDVDVHRRVTFTLAKIGNPQAVEALTNISKNNPNEEIQSIASKHWILPQILLMVIL